MSKPMAGSKDKKRGVDPRLSHRQCLIIKEAKKTGKKTFSLKKDGEYGRRTVTLENWSFQDDMIFLKGFRYLPDNIGDDVLITAMLDNEIIKENAAVGGALTQGKFNSMSKQIKTTLAFGESSKRFNRLLKSQEFKKRLRQQVDGTAVASAGSHPSAKFVTQEYLDKALSEAKDDTKKALAEAKGDTEKARASDMAQNSGNHARLEKIVSDIRVGVVGIQKLHTDLAVEVQTVNQSITGLQLENKSHQQQINVEGLSENVEGLSENVSGLNIVNKLLGIVADMEDNDVDVQEMKQELANLKKIFQQALVSSKGGNGCVRRGHLRDDED